MVKGILAILVFSAVMMCFQNNAKAYHGSVHFTIIEKAISNNQAFDSFLINQLKFPSGINTPARYLTKERTISEWFAYGGEAEDFGQYQNSIFGAITTRASNHFHDPLKEWVEAGLDHFGTDFNYYYNYSKLPVSQILWGLAPGMQVFSENTTGDHSWEMARRSYYKYLTGKEFSGKITALSRGEREGALLECFRSVGQVMHLLQDASVPLHTRNDAHILPMAGFGRWTYETYTKENRKLLDYTPDSPGDIPPHNLITDPCPDSAYSDLPPVTGLFDRNQYNTGDPIPAGGAMIGLAEYSNANFLTEDTMWKCPHPQLTETSYNPSVWTTQQILSDKDSQEVNQIYFEKTAGFPIKHLMGASYWFVNIHGTNLKELKRAFILDEVCFADYAAKLVPRAVGYSSAMLDYFFRGRFDVRAVAVQGDTYGRITGLDLEVKNSTLAADGATPEALKSGSLEISCRYSFPFDDEIRYLPGENCYVVSGAGDPVNSDYVSVSVSFQPENYVPAMADKVEFTLAFRGEMGLENDAVAGMVFETPSRIAYSYRPGLWPNPSHIWTMLSDGSEKRQITNNALNEEFFFSPSWGPIGRLLAFENEYATCLGLSDCYSPPREIVVADTASPDQYPANVMHRLRIDDNGGAHPIRTLLHPTISPDAKRVAAAATGLGTQGSYFYGLVVFDLSLGSLCYINGYQFWDRIAWLENKSSISWSPCGEQIVYSVLDFNETSGLDICRIYDNGGDEFKLTDDNFNDVDPSWSPDGKRIVFVSNRDGGANYDVWHMDRDGKDLRKLADCNPSCSGPTFSADGSQVVFDCGMNVHTIDIDGKNSKLLQTDSENPSWSKYMVKIP